MLEEKGGHLMKETLLKFFPLIKTILGIGMMLIAVYTAIEFFASTGDSGIKLTYTLNDSINLVPIVHVVMTFLAFGLGGIFIMFQERSWTILLVFGVFWNLYTWFQAHVASGLAYGLLASIYENYHSIFQWGLIVSLILIPFYVWLEKAFDEAESI